MDGVRNRPNNWQDIQNLFPSRVYVCGYCHNEISSRTGYKAGNHGEIHICYHCSFPTFFGLGPDGQTPLKVPGDLPGGSVANVDAGVAWLYEEARQCVGAGANTAAVLMCRKMLVNLAVSQGETWEKGKPFTKYVEFIAGKVFAPDYTASWIDRIREKGNTATHELGAMSRGDAMLLIEFIEMLLKVLYEYPTAGTVQATGAA